MRTGESRKRKTGKVRTGMATWVGKKLERKVRKHRYRCRWSGREAKLQVGREIDG